MGIVAVGKAAGPMLMGTLDALGESAVSGVVVSHQHVEVPDRFTSYIGSHPIPDEKSELAGRAVIGYLDTCDVDGLVFLISGGGSSLIEVPSQGVSISELAELHDRLMRTGLPIDALNAVRRSLSLVKNGGLLSHVDVPSVTLLISDVGDAPPETIASGPTMHVPIDPASVRQVIEQAGISLSQSMTDHLDRTSEPPNPAGWEVIASGLTAAAAAIASLESEGHTVHRSPRPFYGEARRVANAKVRGAEPGFSVGSGEATVTVTGNGTGGRNTEAALAAAIAIEDRTDLVFAALTTDGKDGETDSAGAIVDGETTQRIKSAGLDPIACLMDNDSFPALDASDDLVRTGPTGTNVADLWFTWKSD